MATQAFGFFDQQLPEPLYQQLLSYQQHRGHHTLAAALIELLTNALPAEAGSSDILSSAGSSELGVDPTAVFSPAVALPVTSSNAKPAAVDEKISQLEQRLDSLTQELRQLRRESPDQLDRLREQVAAVRLSHSGLIQALSRRVETLESTTFAPFHLQPDAIGLGAPLRNDALSRLPHPELLLIRGPLPDEIIGEKIMAHGPMLNSSVTNSSTTNGSATNGLYTPESSAGS